MCVRLHLDEGQVQHTGGYNSEMCAHLASPSLFHWVHTQTHTGTHTQTDTNTHKHTHTDTRTQTHTNRHTHTDTHRHTHTQTQTHTNTHTQTHAHKHTQTHTHTHTHAIRDADAGKNTLYPRAVTPTPPSPWLHCGNAPASQRRVCHHGHGRHGTRMRSRDDFCPRTPDPHRVRQRCARTPRSQRTKIVLIPPKGKGNPWGVVHDVTIVVRHAHAHEV